MDDTTWIGLDVHKATTNFAILRPGDETLLEGQIVTETTKIERLLKKHADGTSIRCCYEAGPCGYELKRRLEAAGIACEVVAPSLIPSKPGERIKTDRRDAAKLVRLLRAGDLTAIRVPSEAEEAVRDLCRCREDAKEDLTRARHRLSKMLLRRGRTYRDGKAWTKRHWDWIRGQRFDDVNAQACLDSYVVSVEQTMERIKGLDAEIERVTESEAWRAPVGRLSAFRGISKAGALVLASEIGDFRRFGHPKALSGFVGLVPSEFSSGRQRRQGSITKTGNAHVRRVLVEAAWHYRHRPGMGRALQARLKDQPEGARQLAWKAQERLHRRFSRLVSRGKRSTVATVAVARELACGSVSTLV